MSDRYQHLQKMSSDQLEKLLQEDAQRSDDRQMDTEQVFYILQLLEERGAGNGADPVKAYGSFRKEYLTKEQRECKVQCKVRPFAKYVGVAAAAAAAVVLTVSVLWPQLSGLGKSRQFKLESLSANSVSIQDASGKQTAVGRVEFDQYSLCAIIDPETDAAEEYDYTAVVTYTYYPVDATSAEGLRTASFVLSTNGKGKTGEQIAFFPGKISGICSATATFRAVERKENGRTVLQDATVEFPQVNSGG